MVKTRTAVIHCGGGTNRAVLVRGLNHGTCFLVSRIYDGGLDMFKAILDTTGGRGTSHI